VRWYDSLRRRAEIAYVRRRGRVASFGTLTAYVAATDAPRTRFGVTVSSQVGGAVVRNLVRRRIKGALDAFPAPSRPVRILFVAKPAAAAAPYQRLAADVGRALGATPAGPGR
jgi:ribonuclease P protein component